MVMASVRGHVEMVEEPPTRFGDVADRGVERLQVGTRGCVKAADLPNELKCGVVQLLIRWCVVRGSEPFDVPAHMSTNLLKSAAVYPVICRPRFVLVM
jgi:hypothetical protein